MSEPEHPSPARAPALDPRTTVLLKIDYRNLGVEVKNSDNKELYIEGEIDRGNKNGVEIVTVNIEIHVKG